MLGKQALVVDDSQTARMVLKHQLNKIDVVVESACDGKHALELLRDHQPDVIFLDHIMPGLDGFQVLQRLKDNRNTRGIPVIMYTSQTAPEYKSEAKSLGAIGVIPKKVSNEQLAQMLDRAELYRLKAVNADQYSVTETPVQGDGQAAATGVTREARREARRAAASLTPIVTRSAKQKATGAVSTVEGRGSTHGHHRVQSTPALSWLAMPLLLFVLLAQGYGIMRDHNQQQIISDLRTQVIRQERQLLETKEQLASEQRHLADVSWKQMQFVVDVLLDQLQRDQGEE